MIVGFDLLNQNLLKILLIWLKDKFNSNFFSNLPDTKFLKISHDAAILKLVL